MSSSAKAKVVLITGATGNLGSKLRSHLEGRYALRLLDKDPRGDDKVQQADLAKWDRGWVDSLAGVDVVVHLAADPLAHQTWTNLLGANVDALIHVLQAAVEHKVQRVIYASSNHVMGRYADDTSAPRLTVDMPPRPGARYVSLGEYRDSTPYGSAKLFGERLGKCFSEMHGLQVIAVRIGWVRPGENLAKEIPSERGPWFRLMWLSNRDYCHLMERCILADLDSPFLVINGMSNNTGMRWDIDHTRRTVGYEPQDDVIRSP